MTPRLASPRTLAALLFGCLILGAIASPPPAQALKVATWNLIDYPNNNPTGRAPYIRTVMAALDPDVIILQELKENPPGTPTGADSFLVNILGVIQPGQWARGTYIGSAESCVFYKTAKVNLTFAGSGVVTGGPRQAYAVRLKFPDYASRFAEFRLYSVHYKAGTPLASTTDSTTRRQECTNLRTSLNGANLAVVTPNLLVGGDTNFYGDWEGGYIRLTESQADNDGRLFDFFSLPGTWNQTAYRGHHTQSTCLSGDCPSFWSSGGLDDRFDFFLSSNVVQDGEGFDFVPGSWHYFGNDAAHYNNAVDGGGFNSDVGLTVATALRLSSDHLPVILTLQAPAKITAQSKLLFGSVIVGATAQQTLNVSNPALVPADELTYSLAAPSGYTAPGGTLIANAGAAANAHTITLDTSVPAIRNGTLTVANDDPDSSSKAVLMSGNVLAHAAPSLDAGGIAHESILDFGNHAPGGFTDQDACVYNLDWTTLQSKYVVSNAVITGGAGRFSIVGGFTPTSVSDQACFPIHFDDTGATLDSAYVGTLTFTGSDEALPGGTAAPTLTLSLRAYTGTTVGAPSWRPDRLAFLAPRPNPFRDRVELAFDLPRTADVSLDLFDLGGRRVARILDGHRVAGRHTLQWAPVDDAGTRLEAGLYFVRFRTSGYAVTRRLVLLP
jgi:hypothetical protein